MADGRPCASKSDMSVTALVFAGLLVVITLFGTVSGALCGAVETTPKIHSNIHSNIKQSLSDDSRLVHNENIIGFSPNDPLATCGHERNKMGERCRERVAAQSAGQHTSQTTP